MRAKRQKICQNDFYCPNCGQRAFTLPRKVGKQHERFHRKKLYCPWCKETLNCIECKNDEDIFDFKIAFENGEFLQEVQMSIVECAKV